MKDESSPTSLRRHGGNRPQDQTTAILLDVARTLLEVAGPDALTVRRIAAAAQLSTMNVYSRFGGRDAIIDELYSEGFHRLRSRLAACPKTAESIENFRALGIAYRAFAIENRTFYLLMFSRPIVRYVPSVEAHRVALDGFDELVEHIRELTHEIEITTDDAHDMAASHWATCHGHVELELRGIGPVGIDWERTLAGSLDALHHTMLIRAAG